MVQQNSFNYFRMREDQERQAADSAKCAEARAAHLDMADRYADQCWSLDEGYRVHLSRSAG